MAQGRIFQESKEEREERKAFYRVGGGDAEHPHPHVVRLLEIGCSGSMQLQEKREPGEAVTVTIADADGNVIASQQAEIVAAGFNHKEKDGVLFVTRKHKVDLG
jgi:predicted SPOUT superfamily RNA methylase MTH1